MKEALRRYPFFILLVPVFYLLHLLNEYFHLLSFPDLFVKETWWYLSVSVIFFALLRKKKPAIQSLAIVVLCIQFFFFFFGAIRDFFSNHLEVLSHYQVLMPVFVVGLLLLITVAWRRKNALSNLFPYLNTLLIVLTVYEIVMFLFLQTTNGQVRNTLTGNSPMVKNYRSCDTCIKPDIYFLVFDGYAGKESLKNYFAYDNSSVDSFFRTSGFYVPAHSSSNYNVTSYSVGSILNMDYHRSLQIKQLTTREFMEGAATIAKNDFCEILKRSGYRFFNYSFFNMSYDKTRVSPFYIVNKRELIVYQTFWDRFVDEMGWRFGIKASKKVEQDEKDELLKENRIHFKRIGETYNGISSLSRAKNTEPIFVYGHFILPHDPYFYDSTGHLLPEKDWTAPRKDKDKYLSQLKYTNTLIRKLTDQLIADIRRPRIIVIESDHGYRAYDETVPKKAQFNNLSAFYFPGKHYSSLPDSVSSVNTFRFVLNNYFGMNVPLLKDTSVYIQVW